MSPARTYRITAPHSLQTMPAWPPLISTTRHPQRRPSYPLFRGPFDSYPRERDRQFTVDGASVRLIASGNTGVRAKDFRRPARPAKNAIRFCLLRSPSSEDFILSPNHGRRRPFWPDRRPRALSHRARIISQPSCGARTRACRVKTDSSRRLCALPPCDGMSAGAARTSACATSADGQM